MTERDIAHTIAEHAQAARLALVGGFEGVELHAANGYLIEQYLNANVNHRHDGYGGSIAGRNRLRHILTHDRVAAGKTLLISQPLENPMRRASWKGLCGGMIAASGIGLFVIPMLYMTFQSLRERAGEQFQRAAEGKSWMVGAVP